MAIQFSATLMKLAPKDGADGKTMQIGFEKLFDPHLLADLAGCFGDRVVVTINGEQQTLEFPEQEIAGSEPPRR